MHSQWSAYLYWGLSMFNQANLSHPTMQAKIFVALQRTRVKSLKSSDGCAFTYIHNQKGKRVIRVWFDRTRPSPIAFECVAGGKVDNAKLHNNVIQSLRKHSNQQQAEQQTTDTIFQSIEAA